MTPQTNSRVNPVLALGGEHVGRYLPSSDSPAQQFLFGDAAVRVVIRDGEPLFIANDVCDTLGYQRARDAVSQHCKGAVKHRVLTPGGAQEMTLIPERDVYRLVMRSKLPTAERFEEWVVDEVLPTIRKTGSYGGTPLNLNDPATLLALLQTHANQSIQLQHQVAALEPKAQALDRLGATEGSVCVSDAAKSLNMSPRKLFDWLSAHKWIFRRGATWVAYQEAIEHGVLEHKITTIQRGDRAEMTPTQVRVTAKGLMMLAKMMQGAE